MNVSSIYEKDIYNCDLNYLLFVIWFEQKFSYLNYFTLNIMLRLNTFIVRFIYFILLTDFPRKKYIAQIINKICPWLYESFRMQLVYKIPRLLV